MTAKAAAVLDQPPVAALTFSLKTFGAALLALFLGFWLGLDQPKWALMTVYIVSQPDSGLVLAKSFFRMLGTIAGTLTSALMVFTLSQHGELFLSLLAIWIGLCNFGARTARNFGSYGYLLAGYTAAIVGIPAALNPTGAYPLILARFTEISLGIACAALAHRLILPRELRPNLLLRTREVLRRVERFAASVSSTRDWKALGARRLHLIKELAAVETMRSMALFESTDARLLSAALRSRTDAALRLTALAAEASSNRPRWIEGTCTIEAGEDSPSANSALVSALVRSENRKAIDAGLTELQRSEAAFYLGSTPRVEDIQCRFWSDPVEAALIGLRSALAIVITSAFWFATAWPNGPTAVIAAGVACSLVGAMKQQSKVSVALIVAILATAVPIFATDFHLIPGATDFLSLAVAIAPLLIACGFIIAVQPLGVLPVVYFGISSNIENPMSYDAVGFLNNSLAILAGFAVALALFMAFFPESPARTGRRFQRQLLVRLSGLAGGTSSLQEFERALCDFVAATLDRIDDDHLGDDCGEAAAAAVSTAHAIHRLIQIAGNDRLPVEMATAILALLKQITKVPGEYRSASLIECAWQARLVRRRALAFARNTSDAGNCEAFNAVIVGCEQLRLGLLKLGSLVTEGSDVR